MPRAAGRIASARGRHTDALRHYVEASSLYPAAQSARVGVSHSAVMAGDVAQGTAVLAYLGDANAANADPWLDYQIGAGRDVNALVGALWKKMLQ